MLAKHREFVLSPATASENEEVDGIRTFHLPQQDVRRGTLLHAVADPVATEPGLARESLDLELREGHGRGKVRLFEEADGVDDQE